MIVVCDASAAVRAMTEPGVRQWSEPLQEAELIISTELLPIEAANAFWKYVRAGWLTRDQADARLRGAIDLVEEFHPLSEIALECFDLAVQLEKPVYDLTYVVLARRHGAALLTADRALQRTADRLGVRVAGPGVP